MGRVEDLKGRLRQKLHPEKEPFQLSSLHGQILATGLEFHAEGIPWWYGIQMVDKLREKEATSAIERSSVYAGLAVLQREALIQARWASSETGRMARQFRVTDEGRKQRSKVDVRKESKQGSHSHLPIPESQ